MIYTETLKIMRQKLAENDHKNWSTWMRYLFTKGKFNKNGTFTINAETVKKCIYLIETEYNKLTEEEQRSSLQFAEKILQLQKDLFFQEKTQENNI